MRNVCGAIAMSLYWWLQTTLWIDLCHIFIWVSFKYRFLSLFLWIGLFNQQKWVLKGHHRKKSEDYASVMYGIIECVRSILDSNVNRSNIVGFECTQLESVPQNWIWSHARPIPILNELMQQFHTLHWYFSVCIHHWMFSTLYFATYFRSLLCIIILFIQFNIFSTSWFNFISAETSNQIRSEHCAAKSNPVSANM